MSTFFQNMPNQHRSNDGDKSRQDSQMTTEPSRHHQILQLKSEYGERISSARGMERESLIREMARRILDLVAGRPRQDENKPQ